MQSSAFNPMSKDKPGASDLPRNSKMKKTQERSRFQVIIPISVAPHPDRYEEKIARILAQEFQSDVLFMARGSQYTPDIQVVRTKQYWEIKNIRGDSKKTIEDNLRKASKQADRVVISLLRTTMTPARAMVRVRFYLTHARSNIKQVILVTKTGKCIYFQ